MALLGQSSDPAKAAYQMVALYCDGPELDKMEQYASDERISGFTTNPSIMRKAGITNYETFAKAVLARSNGKPVSFEVLSDDHDEMERQALLLHSWGENVYVKIPVTDTEGVYTTELVRRLIRQNVKVNITAVMTDEQVDYIGNMHSFGRRPMIVSIFAGRIADTGLDPVLLFNYAKFRYGKHEKVKWLWASTRELANITQAEACADIITLSPDLIAKMSLLGKDLTEYSLETVRQFYNDGKGIEL